jgi:hypothetical protein
MCVNVLPYLLLQTQLKPLFVNLWEKGNSQQSNNLKI